MDEHFVPPASRATPPGASGDASAPAPLDDPRALQILSTEHWSLLSARSLVYNEAFARAGMFLAFLSATLVVLGLISTATGFSDAFLIVTAVVLSLDLFIGLATLGRIGAASNEDIRYLQGMNRIRHAYHEMVPGIDRYFITSGYDDFRSVVAHYGPTTFGSVAGLAHGLTTTPGMISVICGAVAGGLLAVILLLVTHDAVLAGVGGVIGLAIFVAIVTVVAMGSVMRFSSSIRAKFPAPGTTRGHSAADTGPGGGGASDSPISTSIGTARAAVSITGQWSTAQRTTSSNVARSAEAATSETATFSDSTPAGTASSRPRIPRSSDSLSTVTSTASPVSSSPTIAARMPISEATHDAAAARKYQPGDGTLAPPPMPRGMSVTSCSPPGPVTSTRRPSPRRALACESRYLASSGCAVR